MNGIALTPNVTRHYRWKCLPSRTCLRAALTSRFCSLLNRDSRKLDFSLKTSGSFPLSHTTQKFNVHYLC